MRINSPVSSISFLLRERCGHAKTRLSMLRGNLHLIVVWPVTAVLLYGAMSGVMSSMLNAEKRSRQTSALERASALSRQYAAQLANTIDQLDRITLAVKSRWESAGGPQLPSRQMHAGLYPSSSMPYLLLVDEQGMVINGAADQGGPISVADRDYFRLHRENHVDALAIARLGTGRITGRSAVVFSRRVNQPDGSFAGLVVISVAPDFLAAYLDDRDLGARDFVLARDVNGALLARKLSSRSHTPERLLESLPAWSGPAGAMLRADADFADGQGRFLAWTRLEKYPLTAIAGLSEADALAPYAALERRMKDLAALTAAFLSLFAVTGMVGTGLALARRREAREIHATYRMAVDAAREGFYMLRPVHDGAGKVVDFRVADCNQRGAAFYGMARQQMMGGRLSCLYSTSEAQALIQVLSSAMAAGYYEDEYQVPQSSPLQPAWLQRRLVRSGDGLALTLRDISEIKAHERMMSRLANEDQLTGLPNRNWLKRHLPEALRRAGEQGSRLALLIVDLDNFKDVNDTLGHAVGDELLQAVAQRLGEAAQPGDPMVRLGGDEFSLVLEGPDAGERAMLLAQLVVERLRMQFVLKGGSRHVMHASIGISCFPEHGDDADTLLRHADIALHEAKANGKDKCQAYRPEFYARLERRLQREHGLRAAIERREFELFYQPRVDAATGMLTSMEALVRWMHPEHGIIQPADFIDLAERNGLIVPLGEIVIDRACAQLAAWRAQGLPLVPVSVNVSPRQFRESDLGALFSGKLGRHGISPSLVEVEITESGILDDSDQIRANLQALESLGVKLLIDDFGTGYASLSQLQRLRLDGLKVDRSFTAALGNSRDGGIFYRAIVSMAHALEMEIVAEGVETETEWQMVRELGCDQVQGYLISRPVPPGQVPALLARGMLAEPPQPGPQAQP